MARAEHDREDLFAEAAALTPRVELAIEGWPTPVVVGLHREGGLSLYFDADTVWHFNARGEVRRAYLAGELYKAERGRLVALTRERTPEAVHLVRRELHETESERMLGELAARLQELLSRPRRVLRQMPENGNALATIDQALHVLPARLTIAARPNA